MEEKVTCKKCGRQYDPSMEFVEDYELLMGVDYFTDIGSIDKLCPECTCELADMLSEVAQKWEAEIK